VLFVLIPAAIAAVVLLGLSMCRLAAQSDSNHAVALSEWIAANCRPEHRAAPVERPYEQIPFEPRSGPFRATG
jgi:hypothetical protein